MRPTIVAGNWKLNPPREKGMELFDQVLGGLASLDPVGGVPDVWIVPPAPFLGVLGERFRLGRVPARVGLACQNLSVAGWGAHTGEIGGELLFDFGCRMTLVGHSERRQGGETDAETAEKCSAATAAGLIPLLCVGETEAQRNAGDTVAVVDRQLTAVLDGARSDSPLWIAYEPVWAIGTGRTATPDQVVEVHRAIRESLVRGGRDGANTPILYGGSVKPENAASLLSEEEIDGALVGGASLSAESFLAIIEAKKTTAVGGE